MRNVKHDRCLINKDTYDMSEKRNEYDKVKNLSYYQNFLKAKITSMFIWDDHDHGVDNVGSFYKNFNKFRIFFQNSLKIKPCQIFVWFGFTK